MDEKTNEYYSALTEMSAIKKTNISNEDLRRFFDAGERCIAALEGAFDEMKAEDELRGYEFEVPPVIPAPFTLPDMYMRFGYWEDALRIYRFCKQIPYLNDIDFDELESDAVEKRNCVQSVAHVLLQGEHSQKKIKLLLKGKFSTESINWTLRFYHGFCRTKHDSDFLVDLVPESISPRHLYGGGTVEHP